MRQMKSKIDFSNWLCRASAFHKLVTQPRSNADKAIGKLSETTQTFLKESEREIRYGRKKEFESKHTNKGKVKENDAITLVSRVTKQFYKKNTERLNNGYVTGEPDIYVGDKLLGCEIGGDVKCSWSLWTFPYPTDTLDKSYEWQNKVYMYLTKAKVWYTHYCLVNAPDYLITKEKLGVWYSCGSPEQDDDMYDIYLEKAIEVERNMIFDMPQFKKDHPHFDLDCKDWKYDIPIDERVISFKVEWNEEDVEIMKELVTKARNYLNNL